jgi:hypothetical protein
VVTETEPRVVVERGAVTGDVVAGEVVGAEVVAGDEVGIGGVGLVCRAASEEHATTPNIETNARTATGSRPVRPRSTFGGNPKVLLTVLPDATAIVPSRLEVRGARQRSRDRYCHGLIASAASQRRIVDDDSDSTSPNNGLGQNEAFRREALGVRRVAVRRW